MAGRYLPKSWGAIVTWFINYDNKINFYAVTFGLGLPATTSVDDDLAALQHLVSLGEIFKTKAQEVFDYKDQLFNGPGPIGAYPANAVLPAAPTVVLAGIIDRVDALVAQLKAHSAYTTAIGEDIGIESPAAAAPPTTLEVTAVAMPNSEVRVTFTKGTSDGAHIRGRVNGGAWVVLGNDRFSPYLDTRPPLVAGQAEVREYQARPLDGDDPSGDWSNIAQVSTVP